MDSLLVLISSSGIKYIAYDQRDQIEPTSVVITTKG